MMKPIAHFVMTTAALLAASTAGAAQPSCSTTILYNGKVTTMDARESSARSIVVEGDRIAAVGSASGIPKHGGCARLIDLKGRRVIPGLIDSHNHIVVASLHPGHDVRLESATSIADVQHRLQEKARSMVPGNWITAIDGWSPEQFAEKRMPTLAELDAASPDHPIYIQTGFDGPGATNSKGRTFFAAHGVAVGADGGIAPNAPTVAAFNALKAMQTFADKKRGAEEMMAYAASVGLTTSADKGGAWPQDMQGTAGIAETGDKTNVLNPLTDYDGFLALDHEGKMAMRLRIFYYMQDMRPDLPFLKARLNNQFPDFGDDWLRASGIGERIYSGAFPAAANASPDLYIAAGRLIAQHGWAHDEHAQGLADEKKLTAAWEKINAQTPLAPLRWCLAHVPGIDQDTLNRLKAMGVGVSAAGSRYIASNPPRTSPKDIPPFRMLVESGIHVGYGSDGGTVSALNPWLHMAYMVTGKNSAGQLVAPGQTLTRMQALRLYTSAQGWFTHDEDRLGSIEVGKLADIVVLHRDFLDPEQVPDDEIRNIRPDLTMVGGQVKYVSAAMGLKGASR